VVGAETGGVPLAAAVSLAAGCRSPSSGQRGSYRLGTGIDEPPGPADAGSASQAGKRWVRRWYVDY
jgi:hypothetical protein